MSILRKRLSSLRWRKSFLLTLKCLPSQLLQHPPNPLQRSRPLQQLQLSPRLLLLNRLLLSRLQFREQSQLLLSVVAKRRRVSALCAPLMERLR